MGLQSLVLSILTQKDDDYMEKRIDNPFTPAQRPDSRQALFSSIKNTTPTKRSKSDSKRGSKKHEKSMEIEGCYMPTKAAMPTFMPSPAIVTMMPTVPNPPATPNLQVSTATNYCEICKTWGRPCPMHTKPALPVSPPHLDWSDIEDWDGEIQKEREKSRQGQSYMKKRLKQKPIETQNHITHLSQVCLQL